MAKTFGAFASLTIKYCYRVTIFHVIKTSGGHNRYAFSPDAEEQQQEEDATRVSYCYCRVSSSKQKKDLQRQKQAFKVSHPNHVILSDIGSGLNYKRKQYLFLVDQILSGRVQEVVIAHRDRLARFSFELFEWLCQRSGTELLVLDQQKHSSEREFSEDLLSIIHVFSCRHHGMRRYKTSSKKTGQRNASSKD